MVCQSHGSPSRDRPTGVLIKRVADRLALGQLRAGMKLLAVGTQDVRALSYQEVMSLIQQVAHTGSTLSFYEPSSPLPPDNTSASTRTTSRHQQAHSEPLRLQQTVTERLAGGQQHHQPETNNNDHEVTPSQAQVRKLMQMRAEAEVRAEVQALLKAQAQEVRALEDAAAGATIPGPTVRAAVLVSAETVQADSELMTAMLTAQAKVMCCCAVCAQEYIWGSRVVAQSRHH